MPSFSNGSPLSLEIGPDTTGAGSVATGSSVGSRVGSLLTGGSLSTTALVPQPTSITRVKIISNSFFINTDSFCTKLS